ncbi:MAG: cupin domain-containing protein [Armatimonadota bacterium]
MKRFRLANLTETGGAHAFADLTEGKRITHGGLHVYEGAETPHTDYHVHDCEEVFVILQGRATLPMGPFDDPDEVHQLETGDVVIIEPGEDHHLTGVAEDPPAVLWFEVR